MCRERGVVKHTRGIRQTKEFGEVDDRPGVFQPRDHSKVRLMPVEPGKKDDIGFVESGWR